jgi:hypothetical protein
MTESGTVPAAVFYLLGKRKSTARLLFGGKVLEKRVGKPATINLFHKLSGNKSDD